MQFIDITRTLTLGSILILGLGGLGCGSEEDRIDTGELASVEASPPAEAPEEATDDKNPAAEKPDTEASEEEDE